MSLTPSQLSPPVRGVRDSRAHRWMWLHPETQHQNGSGGSHHRCPPVCRMHRGDVVRGVRTEAAAQVGCLRESRVAKEFRKAKQFIRLMFLTTEIVCSADKDEEIFISSAVN